MNDREDEMRASSDERITADAYEAAAV